MTVWVRKIFEDIQRNTKQMDRKQKTEYIFMYYWHHLLFVFLGAGLLILLIRHLFFREPPKEFVCILVNQMVDYERDEALLQDFAEWSGLVPERILVDSDYVFSYGDVRLEAANESSYEKFFFRWGVGELDAVLMPESFYHYCKEVGYEFADVSLFCTKEQKEKHEGDFIKTDDRYEALYAENTRLMPYLRQTEDDRLVLVYLPGSEYGEAALAFLAFALEEEKN